MCARLARALEAASRLPLVAASCLSRLAPCAVPWSTVVPWTVVAPWLAVVLVLLVAVVTGLAVVSWAPAHHTQQVRCYGMVWYGMAWYGMAWYGMVWYGLVWSGMVWYGMVWYGKRYVTVYQWPWAAGCSPIGTTVGIVCVLDAVYYTKSGKAGQRARAGFGSGRDGGPVNVVLCEAFAAEPVLVAARRVDEEVACVAVLACSNTSDQLLEE